MKMKIIFISLAAIAAIGAVVAITSPKIRFTVHVSGEDGNPIEGVKTSVVFHPNGHQDQITQIAVVTDENGNFTAEGNSYDGSFGLGQLLGKPGYYPSGVHIPYFLKTDGLGHWLPWDATYTTVLRKIGNPIPMYVRKVGSTVPTPIGTPCGYDLEKADWVAPYGKGDVADFVVTVTSAKSKDNDHDNAATATYSFSNDGDGIQEIQLPTEFQNSFFKWPREAPLDGYQPKLDASFVWFNPPDGQSHWESSYNEHQAYFFRARTQKEGDKIISALYGKIVGGLGIGPNKDGTSGQVGFTYYLNPNPNDRNMEYDPNQDLFKNLDYMETPRAP
jgi:hypothetical protein